MEHKELAMEVLLFAILATADTDGDGIPNYLDLDADNDGIPDVIESLWSRYRW
ncbi:MAG: thrombospondin type 3 repeat-containing protein [Chitinophagaceae bacterium]